MDYEEDGQIRSWPVSNCLIDPASIPGSRYFVFWPWKLLWKKNGLIHPISNQTPYSWIRNILWYEWYLPNTIFPALSYIHVMILVEILTVDDVITHLWRHYSCLDDVIWPCSTWYDLTYPFLWSWQVLSQTGHFWAPMDQLPDPGSF